MALRLLPRLCVPSMEAVYPSVVKVRLVLPLRSVFPDSRAVPHFCSRRDATSPCAGSHWRIATARRA